MSNCADTSSRYSIFTFSDGPPLCCTSSKISVERGVHGVSHLITSVWSLAFRPTFQQKHHRYKRSVGWSTQWAVVTNHTYKQLYWKLQGGKNRSYTIYRIHFMTLHGPKRRRQRKSERDKNMHNSAKDGIIYADGQPWALANCRDYPAWCQVQDRTEKKHKTLPYYTCFYAPIVHNHQEKACPESSIDIKLYKRLLQLGSSTTWA